MQPFPLDYVPTNLVPCMTVRSRVEARTIDTTNTRLVEHWQTDAPALQYTRRDVSGAIFYMDMQPTPSRLYREELRTTPQYRIPSSASSEVKQTVSLNQAVTNKLIEIQNLGTQLNKTVGASAIASVKAEIAKKQDEYQILLQRQKQIQIDTLSDNPYFNKYDVAGDPRNIVRELRGTVSEDVLDRGIAESRSFLKREFESRWLPPQYAEQQGLDSLTAFELMRPHTNDNSKVYRAM